MAGPRRAVSRACALQAVLLSLGALCDASPDSALASSTLDVPLSSQAGSRARQPSLGLQLGSVVRPRSVVDVQLSGVATAGAGSALQPQALGPQLGAKVHTRSTGPVVGQAQSAQAVSIPLQSAGEAGVKDAGVDKVRSRGLGPQLSSRVGPRRPPAVAAEVAAPPPPPTPSEVTLALQSSSSASESTKGRAEIAQKKSLNFGPQLSSNVHPRTERRSSVYASARPASDLQLTTEAPSTPSGDSMFLPSAGSDYVEHSSASKGFASYYFVICAALNGVALVVLASMFRQDMLSKTARQRKANLLHADGGFGPPSKRPARF